MGYYYLLDADQILTVEHGSFVYDNGVFTVPLPVNHPEGRVTAAYDFNNDGAIVGLSHESVGGPLFNSLFLFDDGVTFAIQQPENWDIYNIGGMNDRGQFVGRVRVTVGLDEVCFAQWQDTFYCSIYEEHGFVATPAPIKVASKRK